MSTENDRIRILHVIDKFSMDGQNPSSCTRLLADWISTHDALFDVHVCGLQRDPGAAYLQDCGVHVRYIDRGKTSPKIVGEIAGLADSLEADLLHLHGYSAANFGRLAARKLGIPSIVHEHAILRVLPHQFVVDWLLRHKTDVAVAVSEAVREFMIRGRSIPPDKIRVIWNGISLDRFDGVDRDRIAAVRERLGLAANKRVVGTVTRLRQEKGNRYFVEAAAHLAGEFADVTFLIVGDGPERGLLQSLANRLGLTSDRMVFAGFMDDIPAVLKLMDVVVVASIREGFGLSVVEAMASEKPIVATDVGGIREVVGSEKVANLVSPANATALAQSVGNVLRSPSYARSLASEAKQASLRFSIERNVRQLESLYFQMVGNPNEVSFLTEVN